MSHRKKNSWKNKRSRKKKNSQKFLLQSSLKKLDQKPNLEKGSITTALLRRLSLMALFSGKISLEYLSHTFLCDGCFLSALSCPSLLKIEAFFFFFLCALSPSQISSQLKPPKSYPDRRTGPLRTRPLPSQTKRRNRKRTRLTGHIKHA